MVIEIQEGSILEVVTEKGKKAMILISDVELDEDGDLQLFQYEIIWYPS